MTKRNCLILGSGRSGTSMVAGSLSNSGYFMGDSSYPTNPSNPKGMFEDPEINAVNEALLSRAVPKRPRILGRWFFRDRPVYGQRSLARVPLGTDIPCPPRVAERIRRVTEREPYCFKDPRFSYTLPAWRSFLREDTAFVCVFRDPASTALSILKDRQDNWFLHSLNITFREALEVWTLMYRHILEVHRHEGDWLFLHYDQVLCGDGLDRLESFIGAQVDRSFPDPSLRRSLSGQPVPEATARLYQRLCELAEYEAASVGLSGFSAQ
ncbi:MAG: hypothetical protein ACE5I2_03355 [Anaerolineae bacterium]